MRSVSKTILGLLLSAPFLSPGLRAQNQQNQVLGGVEFAAPHKADKTSGVWIDGQYVGYVGELNGDKKLLLLPGEHEISVRQNGYLDLNQKVVVEPGKSLYFRVSMQKDPRALFPLVTSEIKLQVTPARAAVFVDDSFVGHVQEFGHAMVLRSGKHRVKIALPGYQAFQTEVNLLPHQKITIKTDLVPGSITQAGPAIKEK